MVNFESGSLFVSSLQFSSVQNILLIPEGQLILQSFLSVLTNSSGCSSSITEHVISTVDLGANK